MAKPTARRALDDLSRGIIRLIIDEAFYAHVLGSVCRSATETVTPTAAVSFAGGRMNLYVNPEFFCKLSPTEQLGVIKHEVLHLILRHPFRVEPGMDPLMYNIAADLVVNQYIKRPAKLFKGAVTLATFPDLELEPLKSADYYYARLRALRAGKIDAPQSLAALLAFGECCPDHHGWWVASPTDLQLGDAGCDRIIYDAATRWGLRNIGSLPGPLGEAVLAAINRRRGGIDWRRVLRMFATSSRKTRITNTLRRQSKRYGTFPGIQVKRYCSVAVVVDTSGSISDYDLSEFFSEIHTMWRAGSEVEIIECDARVQRVYEYRGAVPKAVAGRGGTRFDPAFEYLQQIRLKRRFDACIYLTDGHAPAPNVRPPCPLLWVVCHSGRVGDHLRFGRHVKIPALT